MIFLNEWMIKFINCRHNKTMNSTVKIYYYDPNHEYPLLINKLEEEKDKKVSPVIQSTKILSPIPRRIERPAFKLS